MGFCLQGAFSSNIKLPGGTVGLIIGLLVWFADKFIVLSYNILADYFAISHRSKLYFHIPRYMLDWDWRKRNILFELGLWSADVMCFQVFYSSLCFSFISCLSKGRILPA